VRVRKDLAVKDGAGEVTASFNGASPVRVRKALHESFLPWSINGLQWGLTREGEEGLGNVNVRSWSQSLQWGLTREGEEGGGHYSDPGAGFSASMGPHP